MLEGLKRLFGASPSSSAQDWDGVAPWAQQKQYRFRPVQNEGFVIECNVAATPWRLEWGPSQRPYIDGQELRLRSELGLSPDLQIVVMNRPLQEAMERAVFEQYVEGVQTRIDSQTPPEMRWLVMFPKVAPGDMPALRDRYVALGSVKGWAARWLEGPLSSALAAMRIEPMTPLVLMIGRGRVMLRTALADADAESLQAWVRLFETAIREARRVASEPTDSISPSTGPSSWSPSEMPGEEEPKS